MTNSIFEGKQHMTDVAPRGGANASPQLRQAIEDLATREVQANPHDKAIAGAGIKLPPAIQAVLDGTDK